LHIGTEDGLVGGTEEALSWDERAGESSATEIQNGQGTVDQVSETRAEAIATAAAAAISTTAAEDPSTSGEPRDKSTKGAFQYQLAVSPFIKLPICGNGGVPALGGSNTVAGLRPAVPEVRVNGLSCVWSSPVKELTHDHVDDEPMNGSKTDRHPWCRDFIESTSVHHSLQENAELRDKLALFRAAGWRLEPPSKSRLPTKAEMALSCSSQQATPLPEDHCESMAVLFSSYSALSSVAPNYCIAPWVVNMGLYGNYDISLGGFLETFCFSPDYTCPNRYRYA
jgi:hypothetical protein